MLRGAGPISMLNLKIIYEQYVPATRTLNHARNLNTVKSQINKVISGNSVYKPAVYFDSDPNTWNAFFPYRTVSNLIPFLPATFDPAEQ